MAASAASHLRPPASIPASFFKPKACIPCTISFEEVGDFDCISQSGMTSPGSPFFQSLTFEVNERSDEKSILPCSENEESRSPTDETLSWSHRLAHEEMKEEQESQLSHLSFTEEWVQQTMKLISRSSSPRSVQSAKPLETRIGADALESPASRLKMPEPLHQKTNGDPDGTQQSANFPRTAHFGAGLPSPVSPVASLIGIFDDLAISLSESLDSIPQLQDVKEISTTTVNVQSI